MKGGTFESSPSPELLECAVPRHLAGIAFIYIYLYKCVCVFNRTAQHIRQAEVHSAAQVFPGLFPFLPPFFPPLPQLPQEQQVPVARELSRMLVFKWLPLAMCG